MIIVDSPGLINETEDILKALDKTLALGLP